MCIYICIFDCIHVNLYLHISYWILQSYFLDKWFCWIYMTYMTSKWLLMNVLYIEEPDENTNSNRVPNTRIPPTDEGLMEGVQYALLSGASLFWVCIPHIPGTSQGSRNWRLMIWNEHLPKGFGKEILSFNQLYTVALWLLWNSTTSWISWFNYSCHRQNWNTDSRSPRSPNQKKTFADFDVSPVLVSWKCMER